MRTLVIIFAGIVVTIMLLGVVLGLGFFRAEGGKSGLRNIGPALAQAADAQKTGTAAAPAAPRGGRPTVPVDPLPDTHDGSVLLTAPAARVHGYQLHLDRRPPPHVTYWVDPQEYVEWPRGCPKAGTYVVEVNYACAPNAGGNFTLSVVGVQVAGRAEPTGGWDKYRTINLGTLAVAQNNTSVFLKPSGNPQNALMNLRWVKLTPK